MRTWVSQNENNFIFYKYLHAEAFYTRVLWILRTACKVYGWEQRRIYESY